MGIAISYKGKLDDPSQIGEFIKDIKRHARSFDWPYQEVRYPVSGVVWIRGREEQITQPGGSTLVVTHSEPRLVEGEIRGVHLQPEGAETWRLTFNPDGELAEYLEIPQRLLAPEYRGETHYREFGLSVKTTGQVTSHYIVTILLRHIKNAYVSNLEVDDDTGFWETSDFARLRQEHMVMGAMFAAFSDPAHAAVLARAAGDAAGNEHPQPLGMDLLAPFHTPKPRKGVAAKAG